MIENLGIMMSIPIITGFSLANFLGLNPIVPDISLSDALSRPLYASQQKSQQHHSAGPTLPPESQHRESSRAHDDTMWQVDEQCYQLLYEEASGDCLCSSGTRTSDSKREGLKFVDGPAPIVMNHSLPVDVEILITSNHRCSDVLDGAFWSVKDNAIGRRITIPALIVALIDGRYSASGTFNHPGNYKLQVRNLGACNMSPSKYYKLTPRIG